MNRRNLLGIIPAAVISKVAFANSPQSIDLRTLKAVELCQTFFYLCIQNRGNWSCVHARYRDLPGNRWAELVGNCTLRLNGEEVGDRCFAFHLEAGIVGLYAKDRNGQYVLNNARDGIVEEWRSGKVELIINAEREHPGQMWPKVDDRL